ncbi:MAG: hypothetical protein AB1726_06835 [Planctomycetota bacterium]
MPLPASTARSARVPPRAGLLGNPSDGWGGRVIAFTFLDFAARVHLEDAPRPAVVAPDGTAREAESLAALAELAANPPRAADGTALPRAALARFLRHCAARGAGPAALPRFSPLLRFRLSYASTIPRQVGFGGSSAIVVATLRALAARFAVEIPPAELAELALAAETEELGITAGPQDRVVQSYGGLLDMDFRPPRGPASYTRLDPALLPPLYVAWSPVPGDPSGEAHREIRRRCAGGDPDLQEARAVFPRLAAEGRECLERGDQARLCDLLDANFAARAAIGPLSPADHALVRIGRAAGAAVKLAGSGGGVVGIPRDPSAWPALERAHREAGYPLLRPRLPGRDGTEAGT